MIVTRLNGAVQTKIKNYPSKVLILLLHHGKYFAFDCHFHSFISANESHEEIFFLCFRIGSNNTFQNSNMLKQNDDSLCAAHNDSVTSPSFRLKEGARSKFTYQYM